MRVSPLLLSICLSFVACLGNVRADQAEKIDFNRDIRPIFVGQCAACHGGVKQAGEISFAYASQVLPPEGWIVEPGDPDASVLIDRVLEEDPEYRMPPPEHGPALSEREVGLLRDWIAQGAEWREHWAYEAPIAPPLPAVESPGWARRPLDRFVLARLEREGLGPSPAADPTRWLRRVSLDLVGLPPSPEEIARFRSECRELGEEAYERAVDRLLASPHYGERWASVWLDQVRYADSKGLGMDNPRTIWKYRDWVVDALNSDMPYDEFTIKQIAGDLLPNATAGDLVATACQRLTQTNEEGGTDDEEFRIAAVLDRVSTTWQTWQGVTFGCVQCHSHPYDPIRHEEFYRFVAFFNNTADCDLPEELPLYRAPVDPADDARAVELDRRIDAEREALWQPRSEVLLDDSRWTPLEGLRVEASKGTRVAVERRAGQEEFYTIDKVARNTDIAVEAPLPQDLEQLAAIRVTVLPLDPEKALSDSEWGFVWSYVEAELRIPGEDGNRDGAVEAEDGGPTKQPLAIKAVVPDEWRPVYNPAESLQPKSGNGFGAYTRIHHARCAALVLEEPVTVPPGASLWVRLKHRKFISSAFSLVSKRGRVDVTADASLNEMIRSPESLATEELIKSLRKERRSIESVATPVLRERPERLARPTHVFLRGLFLDKGERVTAGVPESLPPLPPSDGGEPDRLDLARWIASDENPLTARVAVNRYWARMFGVGLVATEEDFGSSGEAPSHPELLDHLAVRFQDDFAWSTKRLLKEIALSGAYRQTAVAPEGLRERDPANRLIGRGPRTRLPAETVRDQALAVAGLLDETLGGPPVRPPIPEGVWRPFNRDPWPNAKPGDPSRYRRSLYTYAKRSIPYPMFAAFDQPSREFCTPRRLRSNTPLQALEMLNSESMLECAAALAERMRSDASGLDAQIARGFELALCRPPTDSELRVVRALCQRDTEQGAAGDGLGAAALVLLNHDEFLTN
ncbi:DUF1553 domain-containing protein [Pseudobythopirellula maris]|uniref:DUF1553 domain-containing protein n=1 Tax=Pseudobythopirellula maris TaxID=2527991 RepID=UPI0018D3C970|nr:PSD1 and planctomycete cytochrome C domain-containing protein [Pseudobythopirellula maris]